jgi:Spy/CpxP family protein refolding chaperone
MNERQSVLVASTAMAAMFAVGIIAGIALDHRVLHRPVMQRAFGDGPPPAPVTPMLIPAGIATGRRAGIPNDRGRGPERALDVFARELDLTPSQRSTIDSMLRAEFDAVNTIRDESWPRVQSVMAETRRKLDSLLTPSQRDRYRELLAEQEQRFRARDGDRPPPPCLTHPR